MVDNQKNLLRAAERIFAHLQRLRAAPVLVELPETHWTECQSLIHKIHLSRSHSWNHAASLLEDRLEQALSRCSERLQETSRHCSSSGRQSPPQTAREISRDLVALSDEFESVTIDVPNQTLSVTTEPIVLHMPDGRTETLRGDVLDLFSRALGGERTPEMEADLAKYQLC